MAPLGSKGRLVWAVVAAIATPTAIAALASACDKDASKDRAASAAAPAASAAPWDPAASPAPAPPPEPKAPDIIVDPTFVSVGNDRVPTVGAGLADRVAAAVAGRPTIPGHAVDFVAMRSSKPSHVAAVAAALHLAKASDVGVKTEARDGTTQRLPLSFSASAPDCATVAWIAKDDAIDVWPAGGGTAKRIVKGLAGPDMTFGIEAVRKQSSGCAAPALLVGADDALTWGLVFDLGTMSLQAPGARASAAILVHGAVPGRKLALE
jgi:hypothetical protein